MAGPKKDAVYNRSLERSLQILNVFTMERKTVSLTRLAQILKLPKATALRLCLTLLQYEYLSQDPDTKTYSLGLKLFELGSIVFSSFSLRRAASPHLTMLQVKLGLAVFMGIADKDELLYLDKKEDTGHPIKFTSSIGTRRPPYWGMLGPVLMAHMPENEVDRLLLRNPLAGHTKKSVTDKWQFKEWLRRIKERGYAFDDETSFEGISGLGAPIRDYTGNVIAAIGVGFISSSVDSKRLKRLTREVLATAQAISREVGYAEKNGSYSSYDNYSLH